MFNDAKMMREINALKKEIQALKDEQIKQRRDNNDAMYNLDSDNVPDLAGVVKEIRLIVKDGKVRGAFIISAINADESGAKLVASHINLDGATITLNGEKGITITSPNFNVDKQGNVTCNNATMNSAHIKRSCILGEDITTSEGMQLGPVYEADGITIKTALKLYEDIYEDPSGDVYVTKGAIIQTRERNSNNEVYESYVVPYNFGALMGIGKETYYSNGEISGYETISEVRADKYSACIKFGNVYLEVDERGIRCGDGNTTKDLFQV